MFVCCNEVEIVLYLIVVIFSAIVFCRVNMAPKVKGRKQRIEDLEDKDFDEGRNPNSYFF